MQVLRVKGAVATIARVDLDHARQWYRFAGPESSLIRLYEAKAVLSEMAKSD